MQHLKFNVHGFCIFGMFNCDPHIEISVISNMLQLRRIGC